MVMPTITKAWIVFSAAVLVNAFLASHILTFLLVSAFVVLEGSAVMSKKWGNTYSEHVWMIPATAIRWTVGVWLALQVMLQINWVVGLLVMAWLPVHFVSKKSWH
jgi:hypothetical protein